MAGDRNYISRLQIVGGPEVRAEAEQTARAVEGSAKRMSGGFEGIGKSSEALEGGFKKLNRGVADARGAIDLLGGAIPGLDGVFGTLSRTIGNVSDVFGTLSSLFLKNPIGLAAAAISAGAAAFLYFRDATVATTQSIADYDKAIAASNGVLQTANELSRAAAQEKVKEARAIVDATLAQEQQNQANLIASKIKIDQQRQTIVDANKGLPGFDPESVLRDPYNRLRKEFDEAERRLAELQKRRDALNDPSQSGEARGNREQAAANFFNATRTAAEKYAKTIAELDDLLKRNEITQDTYNRAVKQAKDALADASKGSVAKIAGPDQEKELATLANRFDQTTAKAVELGEARAKLIALAEAGAVSESQYERILRGIADAEFALTDAGRERADLEEFAKGIRAETVTIEERYAAALEKTDAALRANLITEQEAARKRELEADKLKKAQDGANSAGERGAKTARELGLAFTSAFEDAIVRGAKLRDVIRGFGQDLLRIAIRKTLTEPFLEFVTSGAKALSGAGGSGGLFGSILGGLFQGGQLGGAISSFFGGGGGASVLPVGNISGIYAKGAAFERGAVTPMAMGSIVDRPTLIPMASGAGLIGEAGAEGVLPLRRDRNGNLGVIQSGGGGAQIINIDARGSQMGVEQSIRRIVMTELAPIITEGSVRRVEVLSNRGGNFAKAVGRRGRR
jgi:hypothetical protein